jgi:hypothetical protein
MARFIHAALFKRGRRCVDASSVIPRTPALDAALAAAESHTEWGPALRRLVEETKDDWPVVLAPLRESLCVSQPMRTQVAVVQFLDAAWDARLSWFPAVPLVDDAESVLCGIAQATPAIRPFLDQWANRLDQPAMRHLADLVANNIADIAAMGRLRNAFWDERPDTMRHVVAWLHEAHVADALELGYFAAIDPDVRSELADAADRLRALQPAR